MAQFVLKDSKGKEQTFDHETIYVRGVEGDLLPFTHGMGTSNDVRYVTFMSYDGSVEYGKKAVAVGDDCADPIARGVFDTPTRESDVQYNYTFYGWATTPNGGADANWNKAITEDKTVYANFSNAVRYYTITYYDSDGTTVLKTESKAYGATLSYTPEKDGHQFTGWTPALSKVTGDASYTATFVESVTFENASWARIAEKSADGTAPQEWAVGDTKPVTLTYADGTSETITVAIAGFNHDDKADGSGKAGISLVCMSVPSKTTQWHTANAVRFYSNSQVHELLANTILPSLPTDLQEFIKPVNKQYDNSDYKGEYNAPTQALKLWALSLNELGADETSSLYNKTNYSALGTRYALFPKLPNNSVSQLVFPTATDISGAKTAYWTRHIERNASYGGSMRAVSINYSGTMVTTQNSNFTSVSSTYNVRFGFCI